MGNLLAQLVLFPFKIKTHSPFPHFSIPAPPPHTSNFTWLFWEIPHNGQLVCTLPGKLHFFPLWEHIHRILWKSWVYPCGMMVFSFCKTALCFHAVFSILDGAERNNCWNTSAMKRMQIWKDINRLFLHPRQYAWRPKVVWSVGYTSSQPKSG